MIQALQWAALSLVVASLAASGLVATLAYRHWRASRARNRRAIRIFVGRQIIREARRHATRC